MGMYSYKAMNAGGRTVTGRLDAINAVDLEMRLKRMDLDFINGAPIKESRLNAGRRIERQNGVKFIQPATRQCFDGDVCSYFSAAG